MRGGTGGFYLESSRDLIQSLKGSLPLPPMGEGLLVSRRGGRAIEDQLTLGR